MKLVNITLLAVYVIVRFMPFVISTYLIWDTIEKTKCSKSIYRKIFLTAISVAANVVVFLEGHYYHYRDFEILGYVKNIWGLNFYYQDIEYFVVSACVAFLMALILGKGMCILLGNVKYVLTLTRQQEWVMLGTGFFSILLLFVGIKANVYFESKIVISEICSSNKNITLNDDGLIEDYIELYNTGELPCKIGQLYLSDDIYNLKKISLEDKVILSKGYLVIPCVEGYNSFAIRNKGETIYLSNADGEILEQIEVPELEDNMAYFVSAELDSSGWQIGKCTPALENTEEIDLGVVEAPVLSHNSGFYDTEFDLEIMSDSDTTVFYSLDGSVPNEWSNVYEGTIHVYDKSAEANVWKAIPNVKVEWEEEETEPVPKAFVVRAVAVDNMGNRSDIVTATYFVGQEEWKDKNVISLIATPYDLFSNDIGIYVTGTAYDEWYLNGKEGDEPVPNFKKSGREWERSAVFELFENSESVLQQNVGIRIQGASTRGRAEKRFSIYARKEYDGSNFFEETLFDSDKKSHSVFLRAEVEDALPQSLMDNRNIAIQRYKPVTLFLNGEYWYDSYLREKYDAQYFEQYYGIDKDNLVIYQEGELEEGLETDYILYEDLYTFIEENNFTNDEVYDRFSEMIDIDNYIDYLCANIYCANRDVDDTHNVLMYRSRGATDDVYSDGKWRWTLYDMDALRYMLRIYYDVEDAATINSFSQETVSGSSGIPYNQHIIYSALKQNDKFCKQFVLTFMDLINTNFSIETVSDKLETFGEDITWFDSFFEKRPEYMKKYLAEEFELKGSLEKVVIYNEDESMGTVTINTITPSMKNGSWTGEYYTDYPVTVTAVPKEGYKFVGWEGNANSENVTIEVPIKTGGMQLIPIFEKNE